MFSLHRMAAILYFWVKMMSKRQTDVRIGILVVDLLKKEYSYMILGALVQKLIFQDGRRRPSWIWPSSKNCQHFSEVPGS